MDTQAKLLLEAFRVFGVPTITESLGLASSALVGFCEKASAATLQDSLKEYGVSYSGNLDGWTLPDAVWIAFFHKWPKLYCYPLGAIAERAVKKTIVSLILPPEEREASPIPDEAATQEAISRSLNEIKIEGVLKYFFTQYLFELSIQRLRAISHDCEADRSYWYHFSATGRFNSLTAEQGMRQILKGHYEEEAAKIVESLSRSAKKHSIDLGEGRISEALLDLVNSYETSEQTVPDRLHHEVDRSSPKTIHFTLHTKHPNISFSFDAIEESLGCKLHSIVKDLLDIGVFVYMYDLQTPRDRHLARRLKLKLPVRHPDVWARAQSELERAVSFLGRDEVSIQLVRRKQRADRAREFVLEDDERCVCLLSGGLDSLAGAVWSLEKGLTPILVSHYGNGRLAEIQHRLVKQLGEAFDKELQHIPIYVARAKGKEVRGRLPSAPHSIMSQHLRSFLFLSLASAVALQSGIGRIYIFENGPVALNPDFSEARVNTRTAHPHFLEFFADFLKASLAVEINVENPFLHSTKGEVASIINNPGLLSLAGETNSCWNWFRVHLLAHQQSVQHFDGTHDGDCLPCVIRRIAMHRANLWNSDARYLNDVFKRFSDLPRDSVSAIADYVRFCMNVRGLSAAELMYFAPDFSVCAGGAAPEKLMTMYRRHADEVISCFRDKAGVEFQKMLAAYRYISSPELERSELELIGTF